MVTGYPQMRYDYYIAGPISSGPGCHPGTYQEHLHAFEVVAWTMRSFFGFVVFSPPEDEPPGMTWDEALRRDLPHLCASKALYLLSGWQKSRGARLEHDIAVALGMEILYPPGEEPTPEAAERAEQLRRENLKAVFSMPFTVGEKSVKKPEPPLEQIEMFEVPEVVEPEGPSMMQELAEMSRQRQHSTGSKRDQRKGKGRFDLLPTYALEALAKHFEAGAEHYGARNWEKGQPLSWYIDSGLRHVMQFQQNLRAGYALTDEQVDEHARAAAWNFMAMLDTIRRMETGELPRELNDLPTASFVE